MTEIEFKSFPALIVRIGTPAHKALMMICKKPISPGDVFTVSDEAFCSLEKDVLKLEVRKR